MSSAPNQLQTQSQGWFSRHWKAVVGFGCLGLIILACAFAAGIFFLIMGSIRSSDVYQQALAKANANPEVVVRLGQPLKPGWLVSGNISVTGPSGDADLAIPVTGAKGKGTIYAVAKKSAGEWTFSRLQVEVEGQPGRIDLLAPAEQ